LPTLFFNLLKAVADLEADNARTVENLSEEIAVVLVVVYGLSLLFTLRTHRELVGRAEAEEADPDGRGCGPLSECCWRPPPEWRS
jgi:Ca2+:H+ antiporter